MNKVTMTALALVAGLAVGTPAATAKNPAKCAKAQKNLKQKQRAKAPARVIAKAKADVKRYC